VGGTRAPHATSGPAMIRLSVVIPFWNSEQWLRTPIESVLAQDHPAEIIAVDDGSTDGSLAIARSYGSRLTVIQQPNAGASTARNTGLAAATGDYVIFLDADDYFDGPVLRGVAEAARAERFDLILSPGAGETPRGRYVHRHSVAWRQMDRAGIAAEIALGQTTPINAQAWHRDHLMAIGGFRTDVRLREDTELLLRALVGGASLGFNEAGLAIWVIRPGEASKSKRRDEASLRSTHGWHRDHMASLPVRQHPALLDAYARRSYGLAGTAFDQGYRALGREALALARECGLEGHLGGRTHRIAATILGLERKAILARGWRGLRDAIGVTRRPAPPSRLPAKG